MTRSQRAARLYAMRHPFLHKMFSGDAPCEQSLTTDESARYTAIMQEIDVLETAMYRRAMEAAESRADEMEALAVEVTKLVAEVEDARRKPVDPAPPGEER